MKTRTTRRRYERACARIAALRAAPGPGTRIYVDAKIAGFREVYSATIVRQFTSGRYLLTVDFLGRTYRISVDAECVAMDRESLYRKREAE